MFGKGCKYNLRQSIFRCWHLDFLKRGCVWGWFCIHSCLSALSKPHNWSSCKPLSTFQSSVSLSSLWHCQKGTREHRQRSSLCQLSMRLSERCQCCSTLSVVPETVSQRINTMIRPKTASTQYESVTKLSTFKCSVGFTSHLDVNERRKQYKHWALCAVNIGPQSVGEWTSVVNVAVHCQFQFSLRLSTIAAVCQPGTTKCERVNKPVNVPVFCQF